MTERAILNLLKELNPENTDIEINDFSKLIPEHVEVITKSLSSILYSTVKENNVSSINRRTNTIHLIRKLCQRNAYHFNVTKDNYCTVLKSTLRKNNNPEIDEKCDEFHPEPLLQTIATFYNDRNKKSTEKHLRNDKNYEYDKKKLNDDEFHINKALFTANSFENCYFELTGTTLEENLKKLDAKPKELEEIVSNVDTVKIMYSLLNLERTKDNLELINRVLEELSRKRKKSAEQIKIIEYISKNYDKLNLSEEYPQFMKKFPFLYEDILINYCKGLLTSKDDVTFENFSVHNENIVKFCRLNKDIKRRVINVLYELYALSNYHNNILLFIKVFDRNV